MPKSDDDKIFGLSLSEWFGLIESPRGVYYLSAIGVPPLAGLLLVLAFAPSWMALDTFKLLALSAAVVVVPSITVAGWFAREVMQHATPNHPQLPHTLFGAFAMGFWIAYMSAGTVITFSCLAKWIYHPLPGTLVIPFAAAMVLVAQLRRVLHFGVGIEQNKARWHGWFSGTAQALEAIFSEKARARAAKKQCCSSPAACWKITLSNSAGDVGAPIGATVETRR